MSSDPINVGEWLENAKLATYKTAFDTENIAIEELLDFSGEELDTFLREELNVKSILHRKRFTKAIQATIKQKETVSNRKETKSNEETKQTDTESEEEDVFILEDNKEDKGRQLLSHITKQIDTVSQQCSTYMKETSDSHCKQQIDYINKVFDVFVSKLMEQKNKLIEDITQKSMKHVETLQIFQSDIHEYRQKIEQCDKQTNKSSMLKTQQQLIDDPLYTQIKRFSLPLVKFDINQNEIVDQINNYGVIRDVALHKNSAATFTDNGAMISNTKSIINIQIGGSGNKMGNLFWETIKNEYGLDHDLRKTDDVMYKDIGVYFREISSNKYIPRGISCDIDYCKVTHLLNTNNICHHRKDNYQQGLWPMGHYTHGAEMIDYAFSEVLRKEVETCDFIRGFQMHCNIGGGSGGGLGSLFAIKIADNYPSLSPLYFIGEKTSPVSTHWVNASLAINVSVKVYGDRVDNLRNRVYNLLSTILRTATSSKTKKRKIRNNVNKRSHRRKKQHVVDDVHKINCTTDVYCDIKTKYMVDRLNIIRQTSNNLLLSSTEWWMDTNAPWITNIDSAQIGQNNEHCFCDMLSNDIDFSSLSIMDQSASTFFHKNTHIEYEMRDVRNYDEEQLNSNDNHNGNHNHSDNDDHIPCIPFPNEIRSSSNLLISRTTPSPLICNRISTTPHSLREMDDDKKEEKAEQESCSTFHTNSEKEDSDSGNIPQARSQTQSFTIPKLRRLTRKCCDMSIMPNLLIDEECLDAFIIEHNVPQSNTSAAKKRRNRKRKKLKNGGNTESPSKKRKICTSMDRIQAISPSTIIVDDNVLSINNPSLDSTDTVQSIQSIQNMVEFPRGSMEEDIPYRDNMSFEALPHLEGGGVITYADEYSVAPSTPKTSVSVPLLTPCTIYSDAASNGQKSQSVLSGVMEVENNNEMNGNCMDLNCVWEVSDADALQTLSPLQIQFEEERNEICTNSNYLQIESDTNTNQRVDFMKNVFHGSEIRTLNKCTYDILCDSEEHEDGTNMTFSNLLQMQQESLCTEMPQLTVAMRFMSLLTVCSDSYDDKKRRRGSKLAVHLDREEMINTMGDFVINISKHSQC